MIYKSFIFFYFLFISSVFWSQSYRDDLKEVIKGSENPIILLQSSLTNSRLEEAIRSNMIGLQYQYLGQVDSALWYHKKALDEAQLFNKDNEEIGVSLNKIGIVHYYKGEIDSAARSIKKAIPYFKSQSLKANALNNLALMNKYLDNRDRSISNYQESLEIYKKLEDTTNQIGVLNNISALHFSLDKLDDAELYAIKAKDLSILVGNRKEEMDANSSLANVYFERQEYEKAIELHLKSRSYYHQEVNVNSEIISINNLGNCYNEMGDIDVALENYKLVLHLMDSIGLDKNREAPLINIASAFQELNQIDSAKSYYFKALTFSKNNKIILRYPSIYRGLSEIYKEEKNIDSSLYYKDLQLFLRDSIDQADKAKKVLELESKYQNKELKGDLSITQAELTESEKDLELFSLSLFITLSILLVTVVLVVVIYSLYQRHKSKAEKLGVDVMSKDRIVDGLSDTIQSKEEKIEELKALKTKVKLPYPSNLDSLTEREKEVLIGVKEGLKDQEIADKLFLSITTIRTHLRKAYVKIDVRNRAEAIAFITEFEI